MEIPLRFPRNSGADFPRNALAAAAVTAAGGSRLQNRFNPLTPNTVRLRLSPMGRLGL